MKIFGLEVSRSTALVTKDVGLMTPVDDSRGWVTILDRPPGAFQQDVHVNEYRVQRNWTVFACQTLIAGDIGKLDIDLVEEDEATGIYTKIISAPLGQILRKPNNFQTWQKFVEQWMLSKLSNGNAYILKERDDRNVVVACYVLDPCRVKTLVAPNGSVFYELQTDDLAQVPDGNPVVPASEIMHDRMWCLFHPLIGLSPIFAAGLAAVQGLEIQKNSAQFFANMSRPSGILVAPGPIPDEKAKEFKKKWEENYTGAAGMGRVAVLGNGLVYQPLTQNAVDSQMTEQLNMSAAMICSAFHVPGYKVGVGAMPTYQNAEILNQIYFDDCLQTLIQGVETQLEDGLGLTRAGYGAKFDLDGLLRMDSATQIDMLNKSVAGGWLKPNEARAKRNYQSVTGGDTPYLQQQNYSLAALAKRDAGPDPFATSKPAATTAAPAPAAPAEDAAAKAAFLAAVRKELELETDDHA